jgi:ribosomal protein S18 acetylase RimI-like enzyme
VAEIMTDTSPAGMVAAIAEGMETSLLLLATTTGGEARREDGITIAITGLPISLFNGVVRARFDPSLPDAEIDRRIGDVVAYLRTRDLPFGWWVLPDDYPPDVRARLVAHGFVSEGEDPAMAIDLDRLGAAPETLEHVAIEEITTLEGLGAHARLQAIGFGMSPEMATAFRMVAQGLPFGPGTSLHYFLAYEHGQPVGTSVAILSGRAAAIFNVATVPEARGRGVGAAVADAALRAAREAGHRIDVLESSSMGYNVYRRLGFEEYCWIGHYTWPDMADS